MEEPRQPEVSNMGSIVIIQENIAWFDITVSHGRHTPNVKVL
jgi:hypothetical protein